MAAIALSALARAASRVSGVDVDVELLKTIAMFCGVGRERNLHVSITRHPGVSSNCISRARARLPLIQTSDAYLNYTLPADESLDIPTIFRAHSNDSIKCSISHIDHTELNLVVVPARAQCVEIRNAIDPQDNSFAINDEMLLPVLESGFSDPWEAFCPVVPAARDQSHAINVALDPHTKAVIFDFVKPLRAGRDLGAGAGDTELERSGHVEKDRCCPTKIPILHQKRPRRGETPRPPTRSEGGFWWGNQSSERAE
jgi:hypothetical protein